MSKVFTILSNLWLWFEYQPHLQLFLLARAVTLQASVICSLTDANCFSHLILNFKQIFQASDFKVLLVTLFSKI